MNLMEAREHVKDVAEERLEGPWTIEILEWQDGYFTVTAFHTISETVNVEKFIGKNSAGHPFYRERIWYASDDDLTVHQVVRRWSEETGFSVAWQERV